MANRSLQHLKQLRTGNIVSVVVCNSTNGYDGDTDICKLTLQTPEGATAPDWRILGQVEEFSLKSGTEDDPVKFFAVSSESPTKTKNTKIDGDTITTKVLEWSSLLWKLKYRITDELVPGQPVEILGSDEPGVKVWLMVEKYNGSKEKLCTQFFYGTLRISSDDNEDMKLVRPTLELDVMPGTKKMVPYAAMLPDYEDAEEGTDNEG